MTGVVKEPLGHRVLQRAHVLAPQAVVGHPFLVVVVFGPGDPVIAEPVVALCTENQLQLTDMGSSNHLCSIFPKSDVFLTFNLLKSPPPATPYLRAT